MILVVTILIGLGVGVMVELLLPGHTPLELLLAICLGVAGALVARLIGERAGWFSADDPASYVISLFGAVLVLLAYGAFRPRRMHR